MRIIIALITITAVIGCTNTKQNRKNTIDYEWIYSQGLLADVNPIIKYLDTLEIDSVDDIEFKKKFMRRFKSQDNIASLQYTSDKEVLDVYHIFERYWRNGLLYPDTNFDTVLTDELGLFFNSVNNSELLVNDSITVKNLDSAFNRFFQLKKLYNVEFGKTGKFYDLIVWKTERSKNEEVELIDTTAIVKTYLLDDFVSLGWLEYVRLGNYYPGGWANEYAIFCVAKRYDFMSEQYLINFLKHETQHFSDRIRFPGLPAHKFEYRGKLLELHYGKELLYETLEKFIRSASSTDPANSHPYANYNIVKDMSKKLFDDEYVDDMTQWRQIPKDSVNNVAREIYLADTEVLVKQAKKNIRK